MERADSLSTERALQAIGRALPSGAVLDDEDSRDRYSTDASEAPPARPRAAIRARSVDDVAAVLRAAHEHRVPITPRAGGTSRVGGAVPVEGGLVLLFDGLAGVREVRQRDLLAVVSPGTVTGDLHRAAEGEGLFYPPDPSSWEECTVGGNVATNAGGPRAYGYGATRDYVLGLEAVTADGTVLRLGRNTRKGATGYDLVSLLVGSEGTLAVITDVTVRLVPNPESVATLLAALPTSAEVAPALEALRARGLRLRCAELLDAHTLSLVRENAPVPIHAGANALLIAEIDGEVARVEADLERGGNALLDAGALDVHVATTGPKREGLWAARRQLSWTLRSLAKHKLSEDVVVPPSELATLIEHCRARADATGLKMPAYGHAGDGNLHVNFLWDDDDEKTQVDEEIRRLFETVVELGGTLSGEHGLGVMKAPFLPLEHSGPVLAMERRIKDAFDPRGILNPGKIFPGDAARWHGVC